MWEDYNHREQKKPSMQRKQLIFFFNRKSLEETVGDGGVIYSNTLSFYKLFIFLKAEERWMNETNDWNLKWVGIFMSCVTYEIMLI